MKYRIALENTRMATLIPASPSFDTRGEERLAQRFKEKLDSECWLWYNIPVGRKQLHPDFVILHPSRGMVVLEVKDWNPETILQADKMQCTIALENGTYKVETNPLEKARKNALEVVDELKQDATLVQKEGNYRGNLIFPWTYAAVLTHITRKQFESMGLQQAMEPHHVICKDEMEPLVAADAFGNRFWDLFPYTLQQAISREQRDRVRWVLFPDVRTMPQSIPKNRPTLGSGKLGGKALESINAFAVMNVQQEQLARSLGDGHRVIHGVAGSGKTLILCSRAQHLARLDGGDKSKPILILCFNRPLASRLDALMQEREVGKKVVVRNFHKWCRDQLQEFHLDLPKGTDLQNSHYAEDLVQLVIEGVANGKIPTGRYQAVLIDEGHDFEEDWLRLAVQMVDPATHNFLLVYDGSQSVFKQKRSNFTFKSVGIQAQGRSRPVLKINYRNPHPVLQVASLIAGDYWLAAEDKDEDGIPTTQPMGFRSNETEDPPILIQKPSLEKEIHAIADELAKANRKGCAWRDMAVLYARWDCKEAAIHVLTQRQIPFQIYKTGAPYRPSVDAISIMGMKVSKGLEFAVVALPGIGHMPAQGEDEKEAAQTFYVAATRATKQLIVGIDGGGKGGFGERLSK